jgi:uncharacterized repeat protein (TIGR03803 family)
MRSNTHARNSAVTSGSCCLTFALLSACGGSSSGAVARKPDSAFLPPPDPVVKARYDGTGPNSATLARDGYLYGTTTTGGDYGYGTVFRISPDGVETVIHSFSGSPAEGANPVSLIQGSDGNLYGTTQYGGIAACPRPAPLVTPFPGHNFDYTGCGTVFKLSVSGELTVLHFFTGGADGKQPYTSLIEASPGRFYGETNYGGLTNSSCTTDGCGVVFAFTSAADERTMYSFNAGAGDGAVPVGLTLGTDGNLYGTAMFGGKYKRGAIFKLTPGGAQSVLYSFAGVAADSAEYPNGPLVQGSDGNFYGTTLYGGFPQPGYSPFCEEGCGTIFRITPTGDVSVLSSFADVAFGTIPQGTLIAADGDLYGIAAYGGNINACPRVGCGTVYKFAPSGGISAVYRLDDPTTAPAVQPHFPSSLIRSKSGDLYGTAAGGEFGEGIVFKVSPTGTATILHSFRGPGS